MLRAVIQNTGRSMAKHVGIELSLPRVFTGKEVLTKNPGAVGTLVFVVRRPG